MPKIFIIPILAIAAITSKGIAMASKENDCLKIMCEPGPRICCTSGGITTYHDDEVLNNF